MEAVNQPVDVFLGVLLVVSTELGMKLAKDMLELLWDDDLIRVPHLLNQIGKIHDKFTFVAHSVFDIQLPQVYLVFHVIFMK